MRILRGSELIPEEWILDGVELEERMPAAMLHQLLEGIVQLTGDPDIGLKAAREWGPGDGGALDHAVSSASSVREAIDAAARYMRLVTDVLEVRLTIEGNDAVLRVEHAIAVPRAAEDFAFGAIFRAFRSIWASGASASLRVLIARAAPQDTTEYIRTFDAIPIDFGAPFSGFLFDASCLDARLVSAETGLHEVIRRHADTMLQELSSARELVDRVRSALASELPGGTPSVAQIAPRLAMSPRTLERKLEREGTTFSALLDDQRRHLALRYVTSPSFELTEIAGMLGFAHASGFYRAFKRWTGDTPVNYRRAHMSARAKSAEER